jgi:hypothetical protein
MVDFVREGVLDVVAASPVVLKIVNVHIAITERLARGEVEVANYLVDTDAPLDATSFFALLVEVLRVVLARALFNILASAKRPGNGGIGITHFGTSVATACLLGICRSRRAVTFSAIIYVMRLVTATCEDQVSVKTSHVSVNQPYRNLSRHMFSESSKRSIRCPVA